MHRELRAALEEIGYELVDEHGEEALRRAIEASYEAEHYDAAEALETMGDPHGI